MLTPLYLALDTAEVKCSHTFTWMLTHLNACIDGAEAVEEVEGEGEKEEEDPFEADGEARTP